MKAQLIKHQVQVAIGAQAAPLGDLTFVRDGRREYSGFSYGQKWLQSPERFEISPDLPLRDDFFTRRALDEADSPFHFAFADTAPDEWGRRIIRRAHAKRRAADPTLPQLTAFDHLASVADFSRIGALRLIDSKGQFRFGRSGKILNPSLVIAI